MIVVTRNGRRERPAYLGGLAGVGGLGQYAQVAVQPQQLQARVNASTEQRLVSGMAYQTRYNAPTIPQPEILRQIRNDAVRQAYATGAGGADTGMVGGPNTQIPMQYIQQSYDPANPEPEMAVVMTADVPAQTTVATAATDAIVDDNTIPASGGILAVSPAVAPTGSFLKTWGPPLAVILGVGLAVYILRS